MALLVVDDDPSMRKMIASILRKLGYDDVLEADSVSSALSVLSATHIALVVADLHLLDGEGIDIVRWLRSRPEAPGTHFFMMTAEHNPRFIVEAAHLGIDAYLMKPLNPVVLVEKLMELHRTKGFAAPHIPQT